MKSSRSFEVAREFLGKKVEVVIDRPMGSKHPKHGFFYEANYGCVPGTKVPDGGELDAYYLGVDKSIKKARGRCIAIIHRLDDDDDKLAIIPDNCQEISDEEILKSVYFQEQWFEHKIVRE